MNALTDKFPCKIRLDEKIYDINADFRNCIRIIQAFEDGDLSITDKYEILIRRLYKTVPDDNILLAIERGIEFLNLGEKPRVENATTKRVYSFEKDSQYIYSAIKQTHQIDLEEVDFLHWWKFVYLFSDVNADCAFSNMVSLRDKRNRGKLTKEEREIFNRSRELLDLDYDDEPSEEEQEFMRLLEGEQK